MNGFRTKTDAKEAGRNLKRSYCINTLHENNFYKHHEEFWLCLNLNGG